MSNLIDNRSKKCYTTKGKFKEEIWPVGQAVKTPPFHGGNMGSSPVRVTSEKHRDYPVLFCCMFFVGRMTKRIIKHGKLFLVDCIIFAVGQLELLTISVKYFIIDTTNTKEEVLCLLLNCNF